MEIHEYRFAAITMGDQRTIMPVWIRTDTKDSEHLVVCLGSAPILGEQSETVLNRAMVGSITYTDMVKKG